MSILKVDTIQEKTSGNGVVIPSGQTLDVSAGTLVPSAGQTIQKVHHTWNTTQTSTSTSYVDITDSSLSFTPKLSTSRLFITADFSFNPNSSVYYAGGRVQIVHDGTVLDSSSNNFETYYQQISSGSAGNIYVRQSKIMTVLAGSTSARTIKLQMTKFSNISSMSVRFNQGDFYSTIVVEEVVQ